MVYIDTPFEITWRGQRVKHSHLAADSLDELHDFAAQLGMRRVWFQNDDGRPHYDLLGARIHLALEFGAKQLPRRELWYKIKALGDSGSI